MTAKELLALHIGKVAELLYLAGTELAEAKSIWEKELSIKEIVLVHPKEHF